MQQISEKVLIRGERSGASAQSTWGEGLNGSSGLTKENSERIGFVISCLFAAAINGAELRQWAARILEQSNEAPLYLTNLSEFTEPLFHIYNIIGFAPQWSHT